MGGPRLIIFRKGKLVSLEDIYDRGNHAYNYWMIKK